MSVRTVFLVATTALGLAVGAGALRSAPSQAVAAPSVLADSTISDVAERVVQSVVNISTSRTVQSGPASWDPFFADPRSPFFGGEPSERKASSLGSGVIVTAQGRILTNNHVIQDADDIKVTLSNGTELPAKLVGSDPRSDVAVLQLQGPLPALRPLSFGDSSGLRLGEVVLAIGDPFGVGQAVTMGIVSAKGRASVGIVDYEDFIQTDAAINPGNSGGALVNLRGELVGINTAILSKSGGYQGIGFAIPSNMAKQISDMLLKDGRVKRGYMGVNIATVNQEVAKKVGLKVDHGVLVTGVQPDSPASKAGLRDGDVIISLDGAAVKDAGKLRNTIAMSASGTAMDLQVVRGGAKQSVKVKLAELPVPQKPKEELLRRQGPQGRNGGTVEEWRCINGQCEQVR
ncbi:MAG: Do family serine endopeptidase [Myxococcales bacterium]|nr:Do family serine endopeptidase [Myxococcales bacterium]HRC57745.1 Do family serine endopeptidase [Kofleriaceae bacterium]